jgi:hypothetical protein
VRGHDDDGPQVGRGRSERPPAEPLAQLHGERSSTSFSHSELQRSSR